jgi:hypothetical protein
MHFHLTSLLLSLVTYGLDNFFWIFERIGFAWFGMGMVLGLNNEPGV